MKKLKKFFKRLFQLVLIGLILLCIWYHDLLFYGIRQGYGQIRLLWQTQDIQEILKNPNTPDSLRQKLILIGEIKKFAEDSLAIKKTNNYSTFYDQNNKPILWVVSACKPYALEPYEWSFGFLGKFSYKGHFDYKNAVSDSIDLAQKGYDTDISEVNAWSTLGYFKDPVLSSMLELPVGKLTDLIVHELTHTTLYVKNDVDFNENLATFIGKKGAKKFLSQKFGKNSREYTTYISQLKDDSLFRTYILEASQKLQNFYKNKTFQSLPDSLKNKQKQDKIQMLLLGLLEVPFEKRKYTYEKIKNWRANNAFFMWYLRYQAQQHNFEQELQERFKGNLKNYLEYLKAKYPSL